MNIPGIVQSALDGEEIETRVSLGGDDELFVTPSSSIVYRAEGLLSDESIKEFPHNANRLALSEGRRKASITLEYSIDGAEKFTFPVGKADDVLRPVLTGVLDGNGITTPNETIVKIYRFSELTVILTSDRLVKHIGEAVWDEDCEEYHFRDVTNLSFEDGSVATQIVLSVDGRPQRIKAPNDDADDLRERLKRALFAYHDVDSLAELNETGGQTDGVDDGSAAVNFGDGVDPLNTDPSENETRDEQASPTAETTTRSQSTDSRDDERGSSRLHSEHADRETTTQASPTPGTPADTDRSETLDLEATTDTDGDPASTAEASPEVLERLEGLEAAIEQQNERLESQQQMIEQLIAELRQGR